MAMFSRNSTIPKTNVNTNYGNKMSCFKSYWWISELCKKHKKLKVEIQDTKVKKHLLLKDYDITMNILKNIAQKTFDCKFQGSSKRIREDKKI